MKTWYSVSELVGCPGMPTTGFGIRKKAKREAWPTRTRQGKGGGEEYPLTALPAATQAHLRQAADDAGEVPVEAKKEVIKVEITDLIDWNAQQKGVAMSIHIEDKSKARMDAKIAILNAYKTFNGTPNFTHSAHLAEFVTTYNKGAIELPNGVRDLYPLINTTTVNRWQHYWHKNGVGALAGRYGNRHGDNLIDRQPEVQQLVLGMLVEFPHIGVGVAYEGLLARFRNREDIHLPSRRAIARYLANWKEQHKELFTAVTDPRAWRNRYMPAVGSASADIERLNQRWEMDSTPSDVMLLDGRYAIIGLVDVFSRRGRLYVSKTSRATAIIHLFRDRMLAWGVPDELKTDNGSDYKSQHVQRATTLLDIHQIFCKHRSPWEKPHIERFFGTFSHSLLELMPGFVGHSVADREKIRGRSLFQRDDPLEIRLTRDELQVFCDRWADEFYQHNPHEGLDGTTPYMKAAGWTGQIRRISNERALDILLAEAPDNHGWRTIKKNGISIDGRPYIAPEFGDDDVIGIRARVLYDPEDLGIVYVFRENGQFICEAENPEARGINRNVVAAELNARKREAIKKAKAELKGAAAAANVKNIVQEILDHRAEQAAKLATLPAPATEHTTAALEGAAQAARGPVNDQADVISLEEWNAVGKQLKDRLKAQKVIEIGPRIEFDSPFERAFWIFEEALKRDLSGEEIAFLRRYRTETKSWRSLDDLLKTKHGQLYIDVRKALGL